MTPDFWPSGWHDNTATNHREYWQDGIRGRHGHRSGISPDSPYREFREPWLTYPDVPCRCNLRTRLVGDGCQFCNPGLAEEMRKSA